jgi:hypothetical protein
MEMITTQDNTKENKNIQDNLRNREKRITEENNRQNFMIDMKIESIINQDKNMRLKEMILIEIIEMIAKLIDTKNIPEKRMIEDIKISTGSLIIGDKKEISTNSMMNIKEEMIETNAGRTETTAKKIETNGMIITKTIPNIKEVITENILDIRNGMIEFNLVQEADQMQGSTIKAEIIKDRAVKRVTKAIVTKI